MVQDTLLRVTVTCNNVSAGLSAQLGQEPLLFCSLHDAQACVRTFHETPLQLLEKIKNFFNETKNLLEKDWNIFTKNCNNSFAKCSSRGHVEQHEGSSDPQIPESVFHLLVPGIILVLLTVGGLLFYKWKWRSHRDPQTLDSSVGRPEDSSLTQDEDRQVELPV
uniref:Colony stimulating factor 1 (macrophage) n=1 Tax=Mus musculus TaxID=10090 RepID=D3YTW1_MOUSE